MSVSKPAWGDIWQHKEGKISILLDGYSNSYIEQAQDIVPETYGYMLLHDYKGKKHHSTLKWDLDKYLGSIVTNKPKVKKKINNLHLVSKHRFEVYMHKEPL